MTTTKTRTTKEACLEAFNKLQASLPAGKTVTRDMFRKESGIPESDYEYHFGTFAELKRAAGVAPTREEAKLKNAIAKAVSVSKREGVAKERAEYGEKYLRTDGGRYKTMLVASDLHDKEIDPFWLRVFIDTARRVQPDNITLGGDVFDLPEFGRYTIDPREWDAVGRIKFTHTNIFKPLREAAPDAQFDLIEGNHECITPETEVLTVVGWMRAADYHAAKVKPPIASFNPLHHKITYNEPIAVDRQNGRKVYELETTFKKERVTDNHRLYLTDGSLMPVSDVLGMGLTGEALCQALQIPDTEYTINNMDHDLVRLAVWIITHATINQTEGEYKYWLSFNDIPKRIERRIKAVVQRIHGIKWIKVRKGLEVEGPAIAGLLELITGLEVIPSGTRWFATPDWFERLSADYGPIVGEELTWASTQGFMAPRTSYFKGWTHKVGEELQWFLVQRNVPCAMKALPMGQYVLTFNETGTLERWRGKRLKVSAPEEGTVISIQTKDGTLITRLGGKINFTGNCRLVKHLADFSPATRAILGDLHGMTIGDLFGLKDFQINYVAKADLKAYSAKEHDRELENNYRVYHDNVLVHHFPHARHMGMPGVNGHHHSHQVWPMFNIHQGAYEWHQLGAGHKRSASYCEGERWHNGFALIHIDTVTKSVNIEYVPVTNMAVVGGKFYTREPSEMVGVK